MFTDVARHEAALLYHEECLEATLARNAVRRALADSPAVTSTRSEPGPHGTPFRPTFALHHHRRVAALHR